MFPKKHKLKLRILCACLAFLVAFVHIPITSFAATDEGQNNTVIISLNEILDKLIKTRGSGITVNGLDEEIQDEIGDAAIVMKGSVSGISYLVIANIMGESSEMYRNQDKAEIINSILSLSVIFVNKKDSEQEINFVFQSDDLCEYDFMDDLRTVKEPDSEEAESNKKSKPVETTQAETQADSSEASTQLSGDADNAEKMNPEVAETENALEPADEPETEPAMDADAEPADETEPEAAFVLVGEAEALPAADEPETKPDTATQPAEDSVNVPDADVTANPAEDSMNVPDTDAATNPAEDSVNAPDTDAATDSAKDSVTIPAEDVTTQPSEDVVTPSDDTLIQAETLTPAKTADTDTLPETELVTSDAVTYQAPVETAVLATALDATALPATVKYEGIGTYSNGAVRLSGKSAGALDIQLGEAAISKKYKAKTISGYIKISEDGTDSIAYCYNHKRKAPPHTSKPDDSVFQWYTRYDYENLPDGYTEHVQNGADVLDAEQDVIKMLMTVGYPNDSKGFQEKYEITDGDAYVITQSLLHAILDPSTMIGSKNPTLPYEQVLENFFNSNPYAKALYQESINGFTYDFSFELEGDIIFTTTDSGSYQTDVLSTKGTLNGYFEFDTLPGNITVQNLEGKDISKDKIKLGQSFRFVSPTEPAKEETLGIRITCKHSNPTIYYYMPENKSFQNLIRLQLSDSYELRTLNILDVIQPGEPDPEPETPPVNPNPEPETPPVNPNPEPETPPVDPNPEPETPPVNPENSTNPPSGGGGPSGNTPDNNGPGPGIDTETTIPDGDVPLAQLPPAGLPTDPNLSLVEIDDGEVPLAPLPKTGQESAAGKLFLLSSLLGGLWMITEMSSKKKKKDS